MNMQGFVVVFPLIFVRLSVPADTGSNSQTFCFEINEVSSATAVDCLVNSGDIPAKMPTWIAMWIMDKFVIWAYVGIPL